MHDTSDISVRGISVSCTFFKNPVQSVKKQKENLNENSIL